jgi:hypothetical protein
VEVLNAYFGRTWAAIPEALGHAFRHCGSGLFGQRDGSPWISIAAGVLDGDPACRPSVHIFVASRAPWVTPEAGLLQYDERPPKVD